tara:strand:- start:757 stop:1182 length:426 start_codon:yes stop_codon:yes gene_type:complete
MTTDQLIIWGAFTVVCFTVIHFLIPSKPTRRKKFEEDLSEVEKVEESINLLANKLADLSAEYYRRYQLEGNEEDLMLSNAMHGMVNDLKLLEAKVNSGSVVEKTLTARIRKEPGWLGSLVGRKGHQSDGSRQTKLATPTVE